MTDAVQEFEYDLAMSFAGEQRDYVEAIVRGIGDGSKVFYDEDEKAKLWGENLIDMLTELYQHKARYVVMFVSLAYAEKMWPNVERQSAMARAARQRSAYILPIRMDDTELPGLLPTVGYLDARHEGLNGIVEIIRQKLGQGNAARTYAGRVPKSQADIELLLALRPDWWEYWLYAGVLRVRLEALEPKFRDYELGFAPATGEVHFGQDAFEFLKAVPSQALALVERFNAVLSSEAQVRAFGQPGEPGDAGRIIHLAERFVDTYKALLDEAARIRGATLPDGFKQAQLAAAEFGSQTIAAIRAFVATTVEAMNDLPDLVAERGPDDEPHEVTLTIEATVDNDVLLRFEAGIKAGLRSLGVKVDGDEAEG